MLLNGASVTIQTEGDVTVRINDARGRLVRQVTGTGSFVIDTRDMAVGAYLVSASQKGKRLTRQISIAR